MEIFTILLRIKKLEGLTLTKYIQQGYPVQNQQYMHDEKKDFAYDGDKTETSRLEVYDTVIAPDARDISRS